MIFVILGMHKSGTTLLARALHESGISMGQDFPPGVEYAKAKYEARWVQEINDEILGVDRQKVSLYVTSKLLPQNGISDELNSKMKSGVELCQSRYQDWGFKDPRAALTFAHWNNVLPASKLVVVYRDPLEVWKRYTGFNHPLRFLLPFKVWCDYNEMILQHAKKYRKDQVVYLNFDRLLTGNNEWSRLEKFVGRDLVDIRDVGQPSNRIGESERDSLKYRMLLALAGSKVSKVYRSLKLMSGL